MPLRKQPPQKDPEEEEDALVTSKQFNKLMHMMESLTASMNESFNKDYYVHERDVPQVPSIH
jgi:hypothetical protein